MIKSIFINACLIVGLSNISIAFTGEWNFWSWACVLSGALNLAWWIIERKVIRNRV